MRRTAVIALAARCTVSFVASLTPAVAHAQTDATLRGKISQLFIFGPGEDPLFLAGSGDPSNPAGLRAHGEHFVPSAVSENGSLIAFITGAIATSVGNLPIGTTSGGETFRFEGSVPVKTSTSAGPIFAERAQTLGQGRSIIGIGRNSFHFASLRGVPLDNVQLIFTHENVTDSIFPGCSTIVGGDCSKMGIPSFENDIMQFKLALDIDVTVTNLYATYGVTDRLDVGIVVPLVSSRLHGSSFAEIIPFGGPTAFHYFAGTPTNPVLSASRDVSGSAFGLGDVAVRSKLNVHESPCDRSSTYTSPSGAGSRSSARLASRPAPPTTCSAPGCLRRAGWQWCPASSARSRRMPTSATPTIRGMARSRGTTRCSPPRALTTSLRRGSHSPRTS